MSHSEPDPALLASMRIVYQPILRLADRRTDHVEVLTREEGHDGIMRGPEAIVGAMTGTGHALPLTLAIMRRAMADYRAYDFASTALALAFNLPLDAMLHPELRLEIRALCATAGLPPARVLFELTETSPVEDFAAAAASITALHDAGFHVALDDIAPDTPYLAALMNLPVRAIKFSNTLVANPSSLPFIRAMALRASARGLDSIAEGIETQTQLAAMHEAGVTHGQGFLFSHPLPASALGTHLSGAA
jgi:EAL domain-containing protein (putative c-di-GMP-specific phosphodiesterase class I)